MNTVRLSAALEVQKHEEMTFLDLFVFYIFSWFLNLEYLYISMYQWYFYLPKLKIMLHTVTYEYTYEENRRGLFEIIISFFKMKYIVSWVFVCSMEGWPTWAGYWQG